MEYGKERKITLGPLPRLRRENPNQSVWGHRPDQFSPLLPQVQTGVHGGPGQTQDGGETIS